ncbi:hypothetical protein PAHAL_2G251900 [Panicum hallii]|jgi:hypothetical protein|uniref:non-specific serine/threonine protein kinase n=1 Tax=Panicum hallii TaxID=206008 RepID=A0A2T8KQB7_9POAL|nr:hypothetical protein PAHAL_2G251900 [Panicum hallii]
MSTGNLVLVPKHPSNRAPLWQSFDYLTDVGLPSTKIGPNMLTGFNCSCISKKSLIDPGFGLYTVEVGTDGALRLTSRSSPSVVYWSWPPGKLGELVQPLNALMDSDPRTKGLVKFTYQDNKEEVYLSYTIMDESASVSFLIDISGQLKMNIWSQSAESWQTVHAEPSDFCITPAVCGPFTVCNSNSDPLFCDCMETFSRRSLQDWELGDRTGGCARNTPIDCITINRSTASSTDVFHPVAHVTLPYDPRRIEDATMQSNCAEACLNDCSCTAYAYSKSICSVWHGELLNVKQNDGNAITSQDVLYIHLAARDLQSFRKAIKRKPGVIAVACIVSSGFLPLFMLLLIIWRNRLKSRDACAQQWR